MIRFACTFALVLAGAAAGLLLHPVLSPGETVFSGTRPDHLGAGDGRLAPCPRTPNCVSSQADPADAGQRIAPIAFRGGSLDAMAAVRRAVESMPRTRIVRHEGGYLHAEFRSRLLGFVDDVEFLHHAGADVIHVRSASRLGRGDFGVNRARVEALRGALSQAATACDAACAAVLSG